MVPVQDTVGQSIVTSCGRIVALGPRALLEACLYGKVSLRMQITTCTRRGNTVLHTFLGLRAVGADAFESVRNGMHTILQMVKYSDGDSSTAAHGA